MASVGRPKNRVELECEHCGDAFEVIASRADDARFCSRDCMGEGRGGDGAAAAIAVGRDELLDALDDADSVPAVADELDVMPATVLRALGRYDLGDRVAGDGAWAAIAADGGDA